MTAPTAVSDGGRLGKDEMQLTRDACSLADVDDDRLTLGSNGADGCDSRLVPLMTGRAEHLRLRRIGLHEANEFVATVHDDHRPVRRHKFALALEDLSGVVRGVAITGNPVSDAVEIGWRLEVLDLATDGTPNTAVDLYHAVARAGTAIGYRRQDILTHTPATDPGSALRAAGWVPALQAWNPAGSPQMVRWHAAAPTVGRLARAS